MVIVIVALSILLGCSAISQYNQEKERKVKIEKIDKMTPEEKKEYDATQLKEYCLGKWENKLSEEGQTDKDKLCKDVGKK